MQITFADTVAVIIEENRMSKDTIYKRDAIGLFAKQLAERCGGNVTWWKPVAEELVNSLPSADVQPDTKELIAKIKNGISVTNADDVYSCGMRNGMRWVLSLIDGKEPLYESSDKMDFLEFLWNVINPNEMEMYLAMYNRKGVLTDG